MHPFQSHKSIAEDIHGFLRQVGVVNIDGCLRWAFGDDYNTLAVNMSDDRWNERHSDLFTLKGDDNFQQSVYRIGLAYLHKFKN